MDNRRRRPQRHHSDHKMDKIDTLLIDIQKKLMDSIESLAVENLNAYERKRIHSFFDRKEDYETKTYRDGEAYILKVIPVGNLKRLAEKSAREAMESGESIFLENLGNYERFVIHNHLQSHESIETISTGEGSERKLEIRPNQFGRSLKKIIKKIKLF